MKYKLAKQLKDAGFPQRKLVLSSEDKFYPEIGQGFHKIFDLSMLGYPETEPDYYEQGKWRSSTMFSKEYIESDDGKKNTLYFPSLSELIEACGSRFLDLSLNIEAGDIWQSQSRSGRSDSCFGEGPTPEEAVANLWLELNKK